VRVLVTNDDGVSAPGIAHLARALVAADRTGETSDRTVVVAAPMREASGAGAGIGPIHTMRGGIEVDRLEIPALEGVPVFGVDALPALIVLVSCLGALGEAPDVIVSGINPGRNVGRAALHSGTIGAALTAAHFDKRALAVSIQAGPFSGYESAGRSQLHFETAGAVAAALLPHIAGAPPCTVVNCNVPNLPLEEIRGIRWAHLARSGLVRSAVVGDPEGAMMQLDLGFADTEEDDESDQAMTARGFVTVTALATVKEDTRPDVTQAIRRSIVEAGSALGLSVPAGHGEATGPAA
jgi:5'-nucleotidase